MIHARHLHDGLGLEVLADHLGLQVDDVGRVLSDFTLHVLQPQGGILPLDPLGRSRFTRLTLPTNNVRNAGDFIDLLFLLVHGLVTPVQSLVNGLQVHQTDRTSKTVLLGKRGPVLYRNKDGVVTFAEDSRKLRNRRVIPAANP